MTNTNSLRLGVNIDHVATLRQARGVGYPDLLEAARAAEAAGAHGITVHLREDRRHIQDADVYALRGAIRTLLNLEMANSPEILGIALSAHPDEVCLVPEKRQELTTEGGLDAAAEIEALRPTVRALTDAGIRVSLFLDPDLRQIEAAAELGAPCVELHTGAYAEAGEGKGRADELARLTAAADRAHALGVQVNAGHGLTMDNVVGLFAVPHLDTLNIGHSLVARAVFVGLENAVREMLEILQGYPRGAHGSSAGTGRESLSMVFRSRDAP